MSDVDPRSITKKSIPIYRAPTKSESAKSPVIIFIHGLSGGARSTWQKIISLCISDRRFDEYYINAFEYPSVKWRIPYTTRMAKLQEIAKGLRTFIDVNYPGDAGIVLVGHSLGGLVARQYIIDELRSGRKIRVKNLIMYATPNTGATLANYASKLSWGHHHLTQLCNNSDIIERLNDDWQRRGVETSLAVWYVLGAADAIVRPESALPFIGQDNHSTLMDAGHINITQAENLDDLRYKVLPQNIFNESGVTSLHHAIKNSASGKPKCIVEGAAAQAADPLFDIYLAKDGPYYYIRSMMEKWHPLSAIGVFGSTVQAGLGKQR